MPTHRADAERIVRDDGFHPRYLVNAIEAALAEAARQGAVQALREAAEDTERFASDNPDVPFASYVSVVWLRARADALA